MNTQVGKELLEIAKQLCGDQHDPAVDRDRWVYWVDSVPANLGVSALLAAGGELRFIEAGMAVLVDGDPMSVTVNGRDVGSLDGDPFAEMVLNVFRRHLEGREPDSEPIGGFEEEAIAEAVQGIGLRVFRVAIEGTSEGERAYL